MDTSGTVNVAHGLTYTNIRSVNGLIRDDADTARAPINGFGQPLGGTPVNVDIAATVDPTNVQITRLTGGPFDNANYDGTGFTRGWIIITYIT